MSYYVIGCKDLSNAICVVMGDADLNWLQLGSWV